MKKQIPTSTPDNLLQDIHARLINFPITFRERVCAECNWSIPTFYRKMRGKDKTSPTDSSRTIPALSNAEKEKIVQVMDEVYVTMWNYCEKYRKK